MITQAILKLRCQYAHVNNTTPYGINSGLCEEFAYTIAEQGHGIAVWGDEMDNQYYWSPKFIKIMPIDMVADFASTHCFIWYNNKFYDSECPQGCEYIDYLPIYRRNFELINRSMGVLISD